jgi:hypothetical protein
MLTKERTDYAVRNACAKSIATQLAKNSFEFVTDDMIECKRKLIEVQGDFNDIVRAAVDKLLSGRPSY